MAQDTVAEALGGVITGISPLESGLSGVHPRLHVSAAWFATMRQRLRDEPWAGMWARVLRVAERELARQAPAAYDGNRWWGSRLPMIAMAYRLGGDARFLELARSQMLTQAAQTDRDTSLGGGHMLYGTATAYDWLYEFLTDDQRAAIRDSLHHHGSAMFRKLNAPGDWLASLYTCNHFPVCLAGLTAAGGALYGEAADAAAWLRLAIEKARLTRAALGPDGASQEGIGYGQYYLEFYLVTLDLLRGLTGVDLFDGHPFLRNTAMFHLYSALGRQTWTEPAWLVCLGDGPRNAWYGPDYMMRKLASEYGDGVAQWFALETQAAGVTRDQASHLALIWHNPDIAPVTPSTLPTMRHFNDQDLVLGRSSWRGDEHVYAFKCGAHFGHHALRHYPHDIGGGHMHPDAGHLVIVARGEQLLAEDEYTFKTTAYHNTAIVNGVGQTGEGVEWFEGMELRREKRGPRIVSATHSDVEDVIVADVAPAYETAAGLTRFVRTVRYLRPDVWVVIDELAASRPSTFEIYWHSAFAFESVAERAFAARGQKAWMRVTSLAPERVASRTFMQETLYTDRQTRQADLGALVIANAEPSEAAVFVTVIEVFDVDAPPRALPWMDGRSVRIEDRSVGLA